MVLITEIEDRRISKPFLGGYRDKVTSTEYFHAASQTGPRRVEWKDARTREVQCVEIAEVACQSIFCHRATQTGRKDIFIPNCSDVYLTVNEYDSHEDREKRLNLDDRARTIQKYYRAYRLFKYIKDCAREYRKKLEDCRKLKIERADALRKRHQNEILHQTFPRSRGDFDRLFNLIDNWRVSRLDITNKRMFAGSIRAENCRILEETTEMLKSLEKHRQCIAEEKREKKRIGFLTENCKPITWNGYKAKKVEMITLKIQMARECKNIYDNLMKNDTTVEDRIELLIQIKNSLRSHSCIVAESFIRLVDQEITLMSNGIKSSWLNNLRERISIAYLNFVREVPNCTCVISNAEDSSNIEISNSLKIQLRSRKLLCKSCLRMLPYRSFSAHVRMKKLSCCLNCTWLRQQNIDKSHYGPYTFLLNGIRADEQRRNCFSSLLYVMREPGIYHLVKNIWHGRSIVSENDDIFNLRLVRFNIEQEWSPWNCILLTSEEAETHYYVNDFENFYSKRLLHKIYLFHQIAKSHFKELISFEKKFRVSSRYYVIQDREEYEPSKSQW